MRKTVLITGASSGIGLATAKYFLSNNWNVVATMRQPDKVTELENSEHVQCIALDVESQASIETAIAAALQHFTKIDAVVNNAGYALVGAFESFTEEQMQKQFNTNVLGLMRVSKSILPHFRENGGGSIVNISSIAGKTALPLYSAYHGSKWAVEGFSESLNFELNPHNIYVKLVEPGPIATDFYTRSMDFNLEATPEAYKTYVEQKMLKMNDAASKGSSAYSVAKKIFQAANQGKGKMRFPAGRGANALLLLRKLLPESWFFALVKRMM